MTDPLPDSAPSLEDDPDWTFDPVNSWLYGPDPDHPRMRYPVATVNDSVAGTAIAVAMNRAAAEEAPPPVQRWEAVVTDGYGFVIDDELLRRWCAATKQGATGWAVPCEPPSELTIVTGTAAPVPQSDNPNETTRRRPGSYHGIDVFLDVDVDSEEPDGLLVLWDRAVAVAAAMNAAGIR